MLKCVRDRPGVGGARRGESLDVYVRDASSRLYALLDLPLEHILRT